MTALKLHRDFTYRSAPVLRAFRGLLRTTPPMWMVNRNITPYAIRQALERGQLETMAWEQRVTQFRDFVGLSQIQRRRWHAGRIAWLVAHDWQDPIRVEAKVVNDDQGALYILSGNHRLRA